MHQALSAHKGLSKKKGAKCSIQNVDVICIFFPLVKFGKIVFFSVSTNRRRETVPKQGLKLFCQVEACFFSRELRCAGILN